MKRIIVIGGGIAGLAAAHHLCEVKREKSLDLEVILFEAGSRLGGSIVTERIGDFLVEAGPDGLNAGTIAARLKLPPSSLTFHLQQLHNAGLLTQQRNSRQLIYAADFDSMNGLVEYLTENCCGRGAAAGAAVCEPAHVTKRAARKTSAAA